MGWTKRDRDVEHVRGLYKVQAALVGRMSRKVRAKEIVLVPEVVAGYLRLSHMMGKQPDRNAVARLFAKYAQATPTVTWRTA